MNKVREFDSLEIENPVVEEFKEPNEIKNKLLFAGFAATTLVAPYISGAIILCNKKKLEEWNWI